MNVTRIVHTNDDETDLILGDDTRTALLKLLERLSTEQLEKCGLDLEDQLRLVKLYRMLAGSV